MSSNRCCPDGTTVPAIGHDTTARSRADLGAVFKAAGPGIGPEFLVQRSIAVALVRVADWHPWLGDAARLLSADEAGRVQRRRIAADREALALAYALHRLLLGKVLGMDPADVPLYRDDLGCPRLRDDIAYTSLSHADGLVALAVTGSGPVGVDIESSARDVVMPEIARSVCHPGEAAALSGLDERARATAMLAVWVRKEALLKAAGIGLAVPMETFAAPEHAALVLPALFPDAVQVRMLGAGRECVAAVAGATGAVIDCGWLRPMADRGIPANALHPTPRPDHVDAAVIDAR